MGDPAVGSNRTTSQIFGSAVGADYRVSPDTLAGIALAGGGTNFRVDNGGTGRSDLFQAGAFVRQNFGPAYLSGALAYGWQDVTTNRAVTIAGIDMLRARFNANALSARGEAGYRFVVPVLGGFGLTPYAAGQFTNILATFLHRAGCLAGSNQFALAYGAKSVTDSRSELGFHTDKSYVLTGAILTLRGREAWVHDYNRDRAIGAAFTDTAGRVFRRERRGAAARRLAVVDLGRTELHERLVACCCVRRSEVGAARAQLRGQGHLALSVVIETSTSCVADGPVTARPESKFGTSALRGRSRTGHLARERDPDDIGKQARTVLPDHGRPPRHEAAARRLRHPGNGVDPDPVIASSRLPHHPPGPSRSSWTSMRRVTSPTAEAAIRFHGSTGHARPKTPERSVLPMTWLSGMEKLTLILIIIGVALILTTCLSVVFG